MKRSAVPAVLAGVLALAGCGGNAAPVTTSSTSVASTTGSTPPTRTVTPTGTVGSTGAVPELATRMAAAMTAAKSGKSAITVKNVDKSGKPTTMVITGEVAVTDSGVNTRSSMDVDSQKIEFLLVDGVMYMKNPVPKPNGKPWVKIDPSGKDLMSAMFGAVLKSVGNPTQLLVKGWEGAKVTPIGADGALTQYQVTGLKGADGMDMRVWVDAQDRPAKMTMTQTGTATTGGLGTVEVTYSDWGAPITITAPPADQIETLPTP